MELTHKVAITNNSTMNCSILAAARQVASIRHGGGGTRVCNGMIGTRKRNHSTQQVGVGFYDDGRTKLEACLEHFHKEGSFGEVSAVSFLIVKHIQFVSNIHHAFPHVTCICYAVVL